MATTAPVTTVPPITSTTITPPITTMNTSNVVTSTTTVPPSSSAGQQINANPTTPTMASYTVPLTTPPAAVITATTTTVSPSLSSTVQQVSASNTTTATTAPIEISNASITTTTSTISPSSSLSGGQQVSVSNTTTTMAPVTTAIDTSITTSPIIPNGTSTNTGGGCENGCNNSTISSGSNSSTNNNSNVCEKISSMDTPYNNNPAIPTYTGIMFEMIAHTNLEILTFELDLRLDDTSDLLIDVYTKQEGYIEDVHNISKWEKVTIGDKTRIEPKSKTGDLGALIPPDSFQPVQLLPNVKQSFYITMLGPYIDFTTNALQKAGEIYKSTPDLAIYVGSGFSEPYFPSAGINRTVNPQFSGVVHYKKKDSCDKLTDIALIEYQFVFNLPEILPEFIKVVNTTIDTKIDQLLSKSSDGNKLHSYKNDFKLQRLAETKTEAIAYRGPCPGGWEICPFFTSTSVKMSVLTKLDIGLVKYELYRVVTDLVNAVNVAAVETVPGTQLSYIGYQAISANYTTIVQDVPDGVVMDDIQQGYFSKVTTNFLNDFLTDDYASIFVTTVDQDTPKQQRRKYRRWLRNVADHGFDQRLLQENTNKEQLGEITIKGMFYGAQSASLSPDKFQKSVEDAFVLGESVYISKLQKDGLNPDTVDQTGSMLYFNKTSGIFTTITIAEATNAAGPAGSPDQNQDDGKKEFIMFLIILVILGLVGVLAFILLCCHHRQLAKERKEKEEAREKRRGSGIEEAPPRNMPRSQSFDPRNFADKSPRARGMNRSKSMDDQQMKDTMRRVPKKKESKSDDDDGARPSMRKSKSVDDIGKMQRMPKKKESKSQDDTDVRPAMKKSQSSTEPLCEDELRTDLRPKPVRALTRTKSLDENNMKAATLRRGGKKKPVKEVEDSTLQRRALTKGQPSMRDFMHVKQTSGKKKGKSVIPQDVPQDSNDESFKEKEEATTVLDSPVANIEQEEAPQDYTNASLKETEASSVLDLDSPKSAVEDM